MTPFIAILLFSALFAALMKRLGQPLLLGYLLAGIVVGPAVLSLVEPGESFELFSTLGISLLLFLVGLGLNPSYIRDVGPVAVITSTAQMVITTAVGWFIARWFGFAPLYALYLSIAFAFSSTIIVLRLLQDREEEETLHGRIAIGFLLVQDLIAMALFLVLSAIQRTASWSSFGSLLLAKIVCIVIGGWVFVRLILPRIEAFLADDRELLVLSSLAWCLANGWLFSHIGFSMELGALFAGLTLSFSSDFREIASRVTPLRDFFLILFFVAVGAQLSFASLQAVWPAIIVFSLFIIIGNPLILYVIMVAMGYTNKTSFYVGLTVAQISEFSLILIAIGMQLGHVPPQALAITTSVGLITIAASALMVSHSETLFRWCRPLLESLATRAGKQDPGAREALQSCELLLFGAHRLGGGILAQAQELGCSYLVVDIDPHLVRQLKARHVPARFGSVDDPVFLDELDVSKLRLVVSSVPDVSANLMLVRYMRQHVPSAAVVVVAPHPKEAMRLYEAGADYVVMPSYLGRRFMVELFKQNRFDHVRYQREARAHRRDLRLLLDS